MIRLEWETHPICMVVRISGTPLLDHALSALELIAIETSGATRLLIDMRGVSKLHSFTDQFALGHAAARKLRHLQKLASLVPQGRTTRNSERAARGAGLDLRVFESQQEALTWLCEP